MYVRNSAELMDCLAARLEHQEEIAQRRDDFVRLYCGIQGFSELIKQHWATLLTAKRVVGILCRQIASITVEDIACFLGCQALGLSPWVGQLTRDGFRTVNLDKVHRVKVPWVSWSKKGHQVVSYDFLSTRSLGDLEGMVLERIPTKDGSYLPSWHLSIRQGVFGDSYPVADMSVFLSRCLASSSIRPKFAYAMTERGYEERVPCNGSDVSGFRPPAEWYYPLYFSLFLDGAMVLLETYENELGGVPAAKRLFEKAMRKIEAAVGWKPLVVQIPPLTREMMRQNRHFLETPFVYDDIVRKLSTETDLLKLFERAASWVQQFGRPMNGHLCVA